MDADYRSSLYEAGLVTATANLQLRLGQGLFELFAGAQSCLISYGRGARYCSQQEKQASNLDPSDPTKPSQEIEGENFLLNLIES